MAQIDIDQDKVARLTDKQRECMHLVVMRKSSKEIARVLGISKPTVDQRIANARRILGASNRDEAAIMFARVAGEYDRVIYDSACVPFQGQDPDTRQQEARFDVGLRLQEAPIPFSGILEHQADILPGFRWSSSGDLNTVHRLLIIVGLTVGILSILLVALAVAQSLSELLTAS